MTSDTGEMEHGRFDEEGKMKRKMKRKMNIISEKETREKERETGKKKRGGGIRTRRYARDEGSNLYQMIIRLLIALH